VTGGGNCITRSFIYPTPSYILAPAKQSLSCFSGSCHGSNSRQPETVLLKQARRSESTKQQQIPLFIKCLFIPEIHLKYMNQGVMFNLRTRLSLTGLKGEVSSL
jgi:hypothetical protein